MLDTRELILKALAGVYGDSPTTAALADHLYDKIGQFEVGDDRIYGDKDKQLNNMIRLTIWNWFPGGGTAQIAADRIEEAIS